MVERVDEEVLRPLKWAKHCVHKMMNDIELYEYDFKTHTKTYIGPRLNYNNFEVYYKDCKSDFGGEASLAEIKEYYEKFPEEYYILKCRKVLFDILKQYSFRWWDQTIDNNFNI